MPSLSLDQPLHLFESLLLSLSSPHQMTLFALPLLHVGMSLHQVLMRLSPTHELFDYLGMYSIQLPLMTPDDTFADCVRCNIIES